MKIVSIKEFVLGMLTVSGLLGIGFAYANPGENAGYVAGQDGIVVRDSSSQCVHTGSWTPDMANTQCDPNAVIQAQPTAAGPATPPTPIAAAEPAPAPVAPPPAPAAAPAAEPAPAPAPFIVAAAPTPPAADSVTPAVSQNSTSLEVVTLFDFARSTLKTDGKSKLDQLVRDLKGTQYDTIEVTGHTDRIGSEEYNMKLSARRALAVKNYLVESGISAAKISAVGKGKADPVTKPGECSGDQVNRELIACLQADRRVDIQVNGNR